ncbi:trypsin-like peptidase domain-containing protein [Streptomyces sp. NBC_01255]|uniref:trypsin-like peptidase domain-containing protein n=1 Tax=Streptomyces sp. NBC_01255 TaxID=2903798 RepID=UPI002E3797A6|nr:trypsin-like peptidase domain-containing protein [Streptomyces sp. NBC_01255]
MRDAAVWLSDATGFLGSGFLVTPRHVVTAAHVVVASWRSQECVTVLHRGERLLVRESDIKASPKHGGTGTSYPFPDLALLTLEHHDGRPYAELAAADPEPAEQVHVLGFSTYAPDEGVHPDSLLLEVTGPVGPYVRVRGDEVKDGMSGSMVMRAGTGEVCGVLKGSRDYDSPRGGWITPVSALRAWLADLLPEPRTVLVPDALPYTMRIVAVLQGLPDAEDPDFRRQILRLMGEELGLTTAFQAAYRPHPRDHLLEIVQRCRSYRNPRLAYRALGHAVESLRPGEAAVHELRTVLGGLA